MGYPYKWSIHQAKPARKKNEKLLHVKLVETSVSIDFSTQIDKK